MTQVSPQGGGREPNKPTPEDVKLLPCPFCGGEAHDSGHISYSRPLENTWWADGSPVQEAFFCSCISCGSRARGGVIGGFRTKVEAITAWNHRTPASTPEAGGAGWRLVPVELSEADIVAWRQLVIPSRALSPQANWTQMLSALSAAPTPSTPEASEQVEALRGEVERLKDGLRRIAEGNLGDAPWQAGYERIRELARATLTHAEEGGK